MRHLGLSVKLFACACLTSALCVAATIVLPKWRDLKRIIAEIHKYVEETKTLIPAIRPLSHREASMYLCVPGSNQAFFPHALAIHVTGPLTKDILQAAFRFVLRQHWMLRQHIVFAPEIDRYCFRDNEPDAMTVPIQEVVSEDEEEWKRVFEKEINGDAIQTQDGQPLFRITFCHAGETNASSVSVLVCTICHAIEDGISMLTVVDDLLTFCSQIHQGLHPTVTPSNAPPVPVEVLMNHQMGLFDVMKLKRDMASMAASGAVKQPLVGGDLVVPFNKRVSQCIFGSISSDVLAVLRQRARENESSVTAALSAALLHALIDLLSTVKVPHPTVSMAIITNIRPLLQPPISNRTVGLYVSDITHTYHHHQQACASSTLSSSSSSSSPVASSASAASFSQLWQLAGSVKDTIRRKHTTEYIAPYALYIDRFFLRQDMLQLIAGYGNGRTTTGQISNVGVYPNNSSYGSFSLSKFYQAVGLNAVSSLVTLNSITIDGELHFVLSGCVPLICKEQLVQVKESMLKHIATMVM